MLSDFHKSKAMIMKNWSIVGRNPYLSQEAQKMCLNGNVENHPILLNKVITTSSIIIIDGRYALTYSGSVYLLENVSEEYASFVKQNYEEEVYNRLFSETPIRINKKNPASYPDLEQDALQNFSDCYPIES